MQVGDAGKLRSGINVTPLVDVVLVLLIIFMVIAPQLAAGPDIDVPTTDLPPSQGDQQDRIVVAIERDGTAWIGDVRTTADRFADDLRAAAPGTDGQVVIEADGALTFGHVRRAMLAVDAAGFPDVGVIAKRTTDAGGPAAGGD